MEIKIDARGKSCPIPVIMAKKEADAGTTDFAIIVDNKTAVENLIRFGKSNKFETAVMEDGVGSYTIRFIKNDDSNESGNVTHMAAEIKSDTLDVLQEGNIEQTDEFPTANSNWAVFIGKEGIGSGDPELSQTLMKMYLYTLEQGNNIPRYILFMNEGIKIPVKNRQAIEHLKLLREKGSEILVCGACLSFYNITELLEVGVISNMYDISEAMQAVDKVITL